MEFAPLWGYITAKGGWSHEHALHIGTLFIVILYVCSYRAQYPAMQTLHKSVHIIICNSYNIDMRVLAHLLHEGAKRPRAINELK